MDEKMLIIGALAVVIVLLCCGLAYLMLSDNTEYISCTIPESGTTFQMPNDMVVKSNNSGVVVYANDNTIIVTFNSANKESEDIIGFSNIVNPIFGTAMNGDVSIKDPTVAGCNLKGDCHAALATNNETQDSILVISKSKDIVDHVIKSISWGKKPETVEEDTSSSQSSSSGPAAYAYKSDGTPMYSQAEVDRYMYNKYGNVNYHVGGNGYVDMDEPGYDDAGHWVGYR